MHFDLNRAPRYSRSIFCRHQGSCEICSSRTGAGTFKNERGARSVLYLHEMGSYREGYSRAGGCGGNKRPIADSAGCRSYKFAG